MKMKIFKLFMLPLAAFTLASAAAVQTDSSHESKAKEVSMLGAIHNPTIGSCFNINVECVPGDGTACEEDGWTVYGYDSAVTCNLNLKRP